MKKKPIAILDSGIGGLSVLNALSEKMPAESFVYYPDEKNFPYGTKEPQNILTCIKEQIKNLEPYSCKAIVIACHTASIHTLFSLQSYLPIPVFGIAQSSVLQFLDNRKTPIYLLGSKATIASNYYQSTFPNINCIEAQTLINEIEKNTQIQSDDLKSIIFKLLSKIPKHSFLFLGCTHFTMCNELFEEAQKLQIEIIDPSKQLADIVFKSLRNHNLLDLSSVSNDTKLVASNNFHLKSIDKLQKMPRKNLYVNLALPV